MVKNGSDAAQIDRENRKYVPADLQEIVKVLLNDNKNLYKINALLYSNVGRNCGAIYILLQYIVV